MSKDSGLKNFLDWLKNNDRTEEEKMQCKLLDEYMKSRQNLPGKSLTDEELVEDPKTTQDIAADLSSMYPMDQTIIAKYMFGHEFATMTLDDGTVAWAIWRDMKPLV